MTTFRGGNNTDDNDQSIFPTNNILDSPQEQQVQSPFLEENNNRVQSQPLNLKICNQYNQNSQPHDLNPSRLDNQLNTRQPAVDNKWVVRYADKYHLDSDEDYKMCSAQRGICLIINNVDFELDVLAKRKGSDMDAYRFKKIFAQLGFVVESKRNVSADKMKALFKQTAARCLIKHDALIVIILSHGTESGIYGVDGLEVDMNDVLMNFDNKRCRQMMGKPKVFIIQACRGRLSDFGVKETQTLVSQQETQGSFTQPSQLTQSYSQSPKISRWSEFDKSNHPTRTDMLLCFSCHSGYVSTRNEDEGSWLGASLAKYVQQEAYRLNLNEILNMVSREVRRKKSSAGHKQVLEITSVGFDRNLYFNPGLYLPDN